VPKLPGKESVSVRLVLVGGNPFASSPKLCSVSLSAANKASPLADDVTADRSGSALGTLDEGVAVLLGKSEDEIDMLELSAMASLGWLFRDAESAASSRDRGVAES
jgi:hypothetical protein